MLQIAKDFATLIDNKKFDEAQQYLAEDCTYHYFEGTYSGRRNIANIYRMLQKSGDDDFDEIVVSSAAEELPDRKIRVRFSDMLRIGDRWHALHSDEILTIEDGLIRHIEHISDPSEAKALAEFFRAAKMA